jgi:hypothetical protein
MPYNGLVFDLTRLRAFLEAVPPFVLGEPPDLTPPSDITIIGSS